MLSNWPGSAQHPDTAGVLPPMLVFVLAGCGLGLSPVPLPPSAVIAAASVSCQACAAWSESKPSSTLLPWLGAHRSGHSMRKQYCGHTQWQACEGGRMRLVSCGGRFRLV